jgi:hypothetical protein
MIHHHHTMHDAQPTAHHSPQPKRFRQRLKTGKLLRTSKRRRGKELLHTKTDDTTSHVFGFLLSLFQYSTKTT